MEKKIYQFGEISSKLLISLLFYTGIIPILYKSTAFGKSVYLHNTYETTIRVGDYYTGKEVNNQPLGVFAGVVFFLIAIIIWKIVCELIFIIIRYFEQFNRGTNHM